jgi:hypothetical protein
VFLGYRLIKDIDAGKRGLEKCMKQMAAYDSCMVKELGKKPLDVYRVRVISLNSL